MKFDYEEYAGFWIRFLASILDAFILFIPYLVLDSLIFYKVVGMSEEEYILKMAEVNMNNELYGYAPPDEVTLYSFLITIVVGILYYGGMTASKWQGTFGKIVFGIKVVGKDGERIGFLRAACRYLGYFPSGLLLGLGYIMAGIDDRKQALHDKIVSTYVIHDPKKKIYLQVK